MELENPEQKVGVTDAQEGVKDAVTKTIRFHDSVKGGENDVVRTTRNMNSFRTTRIPLTRKGAV